MKNLEALEASFRIACFGSGKGQAGETMYDAMEEVGFLLAKRKHVVVTGGFGGAGMEAPARGARRGDGYAIGYTIFRKPGNEFLTHTRDCSQSFGEPLSNEFQYTNRLAYLLSANGFIVAANGGAGTFVELMAVINLNLKFWAKGRKRCAILNPPEANVVGWDEAMLDGFEAMGIITHECRESILVVETPEQAVDWVTANLN